MEKISLFKPVYVSLEMQTEKFPEGWYIGRESFDQDRMVWSNKQPDVLRFRSKNDCQRAIDSLSVVGFNCDEDIKKAFREKTLTSKMFRQLCCENLFW